MKPLGDSNHIVQCHSTLCSCPGPATRPRTLLSFPENPSQAAQRLRCIFLSPQRIRLIWTNMGSRASQRGEFCRTGSPNPCTLRAFNNPPTAHCSHWNWLYPRSSVPVRPSSSRPDVMPRIMLYPRRAQYQASFLSATPTVPLLQPRHAPVKQTHPEQSWHCSWCSFLKLPSALPPSCTL